MQIAYKFPKKLKLATLLVDKQDVDDKTFENFEVKSMNNKYDWRGVETRC